MKTSSQEAHVIELENAQENQCAIRNEPKVDDLESVRDDELHTNTDLTTSEGSGQDSPRVQSPNRLKVGQLYLIIIISTIITKIIFSITLIIICFIIDTITTTKGILT